MVFVALLVKRCLEAIPSKVTCEKNGRVGERIW